MYCSRLCRQRANRAYQEVPKLSDEAVKIYAEHGLLPTDFDNENETAKAVHLLEHIAQAGVVPVLVRILYEHYSDNYTNHDDMFDPNEL